MEAERRFTIQADKSGDSSGSCAIIVLTVDSECYVANVGDSRAVLSAEHGQDWSSLSRDHRPNDDDEIKRITTNGGQIYKPNADVDVLRVFPSGLSVSRTFGDIKAKLKKYGGREGVIIATPEVRQFTINENQHDFIVMGCDGIFDKLDSHAVMSVAWDTIKRAQAAPGLTGKVPDAIIREAACQRSSDNLTCIMLTFKHFASFFPSRQDLNSFQIADRLQATL